MIKRFIFKHFIAPRIVKEYTRWYFETRDWKKADWRNWVAEEFEKLKRSSWTLKHYPQLKDTTFEDLSSFPISEEYKEAPKNFPAVITYKSTGTKAQKIIKLSKGDIRKALLGVGRHIWLIKGEPRFKCGLYMGFPGLASEEFLSYASYIVSKKSMFIIAGQWRDYVNEIIKRAPFDFMSLPLPYFVDFLKNFKEDIYDDISFWTTWGDVMTEYIRGLFMQKSKELKKIFYTVDLYGVSECLYAATELPPNVTKQMQYMPETNIMLIKKENSEIINIFDAKSGDRGEVLLTPLFDYMVPNYPLYDIIEIVNDESPFGLPTLRVLGRKGISIDMELKTLGHIRGYYSIYVRIMGIIIDGYEYTRLLGTKFGTDHITLIEEKKGRVILRTYTERFVAREDLIEAIRKDKKLYYLYDDIKNSLLDVELIADPQVINEVKEYYYTRYGSQATIPRIIILRREE